MCLPIAKTNRDFTIFSYSMLSVRTLAKAVHLTRQTGFPRLVFTRVVRTYIPTYPIWLWELPITERLKLLAGPAVFTASVGIVTYALAEAQKPPKTHEKNEQNNSKKILLAAAVGINTLVFAMWKIPSRPLKLFLWNYMSSNLYKTVPRRTFSMLGCMFSQYKPPHIAVNMAVLWVLLEKLPEDDFFKTIHIYVAGGVTAAFVSYLCMAIHPALRGASVGASGANLALFGYIAGKYPDESISIPFLNDIYPHSISAQTILWMSVIFDAGGLFRGWMALDHSSHLGGIIFGWLKGILD